MMPSARCWPSTTSAASTWILPHQAQNAAVALAAVEAFLGGGERELNADLVREGFAETSSPGRLELVRTTASAVPPGAWTQIPAGKMVDIKIFSRARSDQNYCSLFLAQGVA